jgi:hypothetical protein
MRADKTREAGFYWVRFEGEIQVAEYVCGCPWLRNGHHWHVIGSASCFTNNMVCELLERKRLVPDPVGIEK